MSLSANEFPHRRYSQRMNVLVTSENRFVDVDGAMYTTTIAPTFFHRYLDVWDEVLLLARVSRADSPPPGLLPIDARGVRFIKLPDFVGSMQYLKELRTMRTITRQALEQADSVLFRMAGVIGSMAWPLIGQRSRPFGVEICGEPGTTRGSLRHPLRPLLHWYYTRDMRKICRAAAATAYVTAQKFQQSYPPAPGAYTTNYSSIELPGWQILPQPREFKPANRTFRLICVGTLKIMYKAQDVLLRALAEVRNSGCDATVTFLGDGRYQPAMEHLARDLGLQQHVEFCGNLPAGDAVIAKLDESDLFVLPSRQEGMPRAAIEAMARGLPCIGTRVGGIPELIGTDELVPPDDVTALASKILELLRDPTRMSQLSARNLNVAAGFTSDVLRARRIAFYERLRELTKIWQRQLGAHELQVAAPH
jgi:glycosyltransferase involved in cell wall biosynthesis